MPSVLFFVRAMSISPESFSKRSGPAGVESGEVNRAGFAGDSGLPQEEAGLSFTDFAGEQAGHMFGTGTVSSDPTPPYTAPASDGAWPEAANSPETWHAGRDCRTERPLTRPQRTA